MKTLLAITFAAGLGFFAVSPSQAAPVAPQTTFGDSLVGYATVRGSIQRTVDGGAHWVMIKTPGT